MKNGKERPSQNPDIDCPDGKEWEQEAEIEYLAGICEYPTGKTDEVFLKINRWLAMHRELPILDRMAFSVQAIRGLETDVILKCAAAGFLARDALAVQVEGTIKKIIPDLAASASASGAYFATESETRRKSELGRNAAKARGEKTKVKKEEIRAAWATGKYSSRDVCAEEECQAMGMSYSTARKALRNTPDPKRNFA